MGKYIIMLSSITYAYSARDILYRKGIKCYIERVPVNLRESGCGYGVAVNANPDAAVKILTDNGFRIRNVIQLKK